MKGLLNMGKTLILIAHRMSTTKGCSKIVHLEKGKVIDIGSYEQLMERSERFKELVKSEDDV